MGAEMTRKENSIWGMFEEEKLRKFQEHIWTVTNFSVEVIDYRGEYILKNKVENQGCQFQLEECKSCHTKIALEAAKAAIESKPSITFCEKKVCHIIIPIIKEQQYLGAFVAGKTECSEKKAKDVCDMLQFILEEMITTQKSTQEVYALQRKEIHLRELRKKNRELKVQVAALRAEKLKARVLPQFQMSMMMALSSFAILEDAEKTEEMVVRSTEILRYYLDNTKEEIFLRNELNQIENYLSLLNAQYGKKFRFYIQCEEISEKVMVPALSIFPFVEYVTDYGLLHDNLDRTLYIDCDMKEKECQIHIQLEGGEKQTMRPRQIQSYIQNTEIADQVEQAKQRLQLAFGEECHFLVQKDFVQITIPWEAGV